MPAFLRACALLFITAAALPASAQMYRCGNVFQDRPCEAGVNEQRINTTGSRPATGSANVPSAATLASPHAAQCARVGEHAQRISWKREGGATMERQISEAGADQNMVNLVIQVYGRRGSAPQVLAAIEAECVAERENQVRATEALRALRDQASGTPGVVTGVGGARPAADARGNAAAASDNAQPVAAKPKGPDPRCGGLKSDRAAVERRLRVGGTAQTMEALQNERREIEQQMAEARC